MVNTFEMPEEIKVLITNFLKGVIDEEELNKLSHWLSLSNNNVKEFKLLKSLWLLSGKTIPVSSEISDNALSKVKSKISNTKRVTLKPYWKFGLIAASWLVFLIVGSVLGAGLMRHNDNESVDMVNTTISAPLGAKSIVDLPDGTRVWINAGSKITYNNFYGKTTREINLIGEAYFSVKTNKRIPFLVRTSDIIVKALGTKFNVKAYPDEKTITTTLEEGKVVLTSLHNSDKKEVIGLKPNQMVTYYKEPDAVNTLPEKVQKKVQNNEKVIIDEDGSLIKLDPIVQTELLTSWKDDTWIIKGEPLGTLASVLERRFNMVIVFDSDESRQFKFTGKIQKETIEQIMVALELSAPIHYEINNNIIKISLNKRLLEPYKKNTLN